jgi:putative hydrolase of the HAD superfamily
MTHAEGGSRTRAVFFDVDFTLIYPGPTFQAEGYRQFCGKHGITIDPGAFDGAVAKASSILERAQDGTYDPQLFIDYTRAIIHEMGGGGPAAAACAREIYDEWAACQHFHLYEEVPRVLRQLRDADILTGLISNTHRCLASFTSHFELEGLITATVSSSQHGFMKPHRSIFDAALRLVGVDPADAVMVGDSLKHDIEGALQTGMRAVLVARSGQPVVATDGVPVIRNLTELFAFL